MKRMSPPFINIVVNSARAESSKSCKHDDKRKLQIRGGPSCPINEN